MEKMKVNQTLDAKGLACPMPIVKTKKAMKDLESGHVLEIQATDKGSKADIKAWSESTGHQYLGTIEEGGVLNHFIRKSSHDETTSETKYPYTISNEDLMKTLEDNEQVVVLDVRETAEYAFNHIPGAISIPLGELEDHFDQLNKASKTFVICRTGTRSDLASQKLASNGFTNVFNVLPGMSGWFGKTVNFNQ
ncbi:sulfurtransferase TusA family protein [Cytobacillus purgationiresistens]|uniref:Rhodanese-related sulfurtransferase/TusA-related sulfurtransferase n=1 Tax=Cytobacillus purgationiresistens TaxID=863449 RepID=A0ABU0AGQ0_9BACI|nr:sulfurtransferase TusA family protein [Cytobacillus purgationiresistens]MDQ0270436.1 rhodanese-related sulfurtransferase/TusA-related sulfurtransferase [Cytobacillus purgationiresistens]